MLTINCLWLGQPRGAFENLTTSSRNLFRYRINDFFSHLCIYDEYSVTSTEDCFQLQFKLNNTEICIKMLNKLQKHNQADVCLIAFPITNHHYIELVKSWASDFKKLFSKSPIILAGFATEANFEPALFRRAIIAGNEEITRKVGDEVARDIGAIKYIKCSNKSGKGAKILVDEIALAHLGQLKYKESKNRSQCSFQ